MSDYYVDLSGRTAGPFTLEESRRLKEAGTVTDSTLFCTPKSVEWLPLSAIAALLQPKAATPPPPTQPEPLKPAAQPGDWICEQCGRVGKPVMQMQGSLAVEIVLWLLFCAPGLIYSLWRLTSRRRCCQTCGSQNMFPATSPKGQAKVRMARVERKLNDNLPGLLVIVGVVVLVLLVRYVLRIFSQ